MNSVTVRCLHGGLTIVEVIQKVADKLRRQNPDLVGRPIYCDPNEKVVFYFTSLDNKTDLEKLADLITLELASDSVLIENRIKVFRDDIHPLIHGRGTIVVSLNKHTKSPSC